MKSLLEQLQQAAESSGEKPFLTLKDKEQVRVRFLQELDAKAPNAEKLGLAYLAKVHQKPGDFKVQAGCTEEVEGKCWACEQARAGEKRFFPKKRLYISALVKTPEGPKIKVLNQGFTEKHIVNTLIEMFVEYGTITDRDYKIKRNGSDMNSTSYTLLSLDVSDFPDLSGLEVPDLKSFVKNVPSDEMEAYFSGTGEAKPESGEGWT